MLAHQRPEFRKRWRASIKAHTVSDPTWAIRRSRRMLANVQSLESRKRMITTKNTPEAKRQNSLRIRKLWREERERLLPAYRTPALLALRSRQAKALWSDPVWAKGAAAARSKCPNKAEVSIGSLLNELDFRYEFQSHIGTYLVDFRLLDYPVVVEVDGYWHFHDEQRMQRDREREQFIVAQGFTVARLAGGKTEQHRYREMASDFLRRIVMNSWHSEPHVEFSYKLPSPRKNKCTS